MTAYDWWRTQPRRYDYRCNAAGVEVDDRSVNVVGSLYLEPGILILRRFRRGRTACLAHRRPNGDTASSRRIAYPNVAASTVLTRNSRRVSSQKLMGRPRFMNPFSNGPFDEIRRAVEFPNRLVKPERFRCAFRFKAKMKKQGRLPLTPGKRISTTAPIFLPAPSFVFGSRMCLQRCASIR